MATGIPKTQWQGNTNLNNYPNNSEVTLSYPGKILESEILKTNPLKCFPICPKNAKLKCEAKNRLYYGDNLPILASLLNDAAVKGRVKLIYIDPPFATKSVFQSRAQKNAYTDLLSGDRYLEFIRQRLIILREILADDGSIYIHIDENMAFYLKVIMDEVFGKQNFRNWITRKKCNPKNYTKKSYGKISDFILFYTKSDNYIWNRPFEKWSEERAIKEYQYIEKETGRRYKKVPIHAPGVRKGETGKPWKGRNPPPGKHWQFTPKTLDEMDAEGKIYWSLNGNPRRKIYLDESKGIAIQDIWLDFKDAHNQNIKVTGYPTEKNPDLLARIIRASSNLGDLVLDCFSGSGTTLDVASQLGRNWLGIDNSSEAIATTLKRFASCRGLMGDFVNNSENTTTKFEENRQLSLFELSQESKQEKLEKKEEAMENFCLYSPESSLLELEEILEQWNLG